MYYLKYDNENIFLTNHNKIILTQYNSYYKFMTNILEINEKSNDRMELNSLILNSKNTLIIDLSSISSITKIFNSENKLTEEYIKSKLENNVINIDDEENINKIINDIINKLYSEMNLKNVNIDILKLIKNNSSIEIKNSDDFFNILKEVLKSSTLKNIFIIYKKGILDYFNLRELEELEDSKLILFEICDKNSIFESNDNILFFDNNIFQITYSNLIELIMSKIKIDNMNEEIYKYLINKIFFYSINEKEVDIMKKYLNEVTKINEVLKNEFKIDLKETLGYI